jgi:two-component system, NarL family, nitrate/nitrite response regulator NarL
MTRVVLYTDEPLFGAGLTHVMSSVSAFELCQVCGHIGGLLRSAAEEHPEIIMLDWSPAVTLRDLVELRTLAPWARTVLWTRSISTELAFQAIEQGVHGILDKCAPADTVLKCLEIVSEGGLWFDETLKKEILCLPAVELTRRESQLVTLLCYGMNNKEIAGELDLSEGTIKVYLSRMFQKLGVKDRFELAVHGLKNHVAKSGAAAFACGREDLRRPVTSERGPWLRSLMVGPRPGQGATKAG